MPQNFSFIKKIIRPKTICIASLICFIACAKNGFDKDWTHQKAPDCFTVQFETTKGNFQIAIERKNSPAAVDRLYQLISHGYYDNAIFYRVVPQLIAQFGNSDRKIMSQWQSVKIPDEPVVLKNEAGTISFARFGKETRDTELFINLNDNPEFDTLDYEGVKGFPALGRVTEGMDVVRSLYSGYGEKTMGDSGRMYTDRADFIATYPNLDLIKTVRIIE